MTNTPTTKPPGAVQLMLTMAGSGLYLEATDNLLGAGSPLVLPVYDRHGLLEQVGRWHGEARSALSQEG